MSHKVSRHLRIEVASYDRKIRQFVPGYETMLGIASALTAEVKPGHVLDLGSGSGGLSESLLSYPEIGIVELWDIDPEMLEHAKIRLSAYGERARFELSSFNNPFPTCDTISANSTKSQHALNRWRSNKHPMAVISRQTANPLSTVSIDAIMCLCLSLAAVLIAAAYYQRHRTPTALPLTQPLA